ncbi:unnamed protein product [Mytilus coruscus]|uniref:Uncharacterized protein n=1 Tax=Mytilus coruscus TaxID=42192 RepID=A0A6J8EUW6_MYTCO|nr:unnamed protein product [Mytilus coruscus]
MYFLAHLFVRSSVFSITKGCSPAFFIIEFSSHLTSSTGILKKCDKVQLSQASHQSGDNFTTRPKEPTVTESEFSPADALSLFSKKLDSALVKHKQSIITGIEEKVTFNRLQDLPTRSVISSSSRETADNRNLIRPVKKRLTKHCPKWSEVRVRMSYCKGTKSFALQISTGGTWKKSTQTTF